MFQPVIFFRKTLTVNGKSSTSSSVGDVTHFHVLPQDDTMHRAVFVGQSAIPTANLQEILHGDWHVIEVQFHDDAPQVFTVFQAKVQETTNKNTFGPWSLNEQWILTVNVVPGVYKATSS